MDRLSALRRFSATVSTPQSIRSPGATSAGHAARSKRGTVVDGDGVAPDDGTVCAIGSRIDSHRT